MLRRLLLGLLKGSLIGAGIGSLLVFGFGVPLLNGGFAYLAVVLTGVFVALLTGKPVWTRGAWVEVLLKGIAAALLAAGLLFGVQRYLDTALTLGPNLTGSLSQLPIVILPLVATVLSIFFEVDNTDEPEPHESTEGHRVRIDAASDGTELEADLAQDDDEAQRKERGTQLT